MGGDRDDGGDFFETSSVDFGEDLPVLQMRYALFDWGAKTGDDFVELFFPLFAGLAGCFLNRRGGGVGAVCNPAGIGAGEEVAPTALPDDTRIVAGSGKRV